MVNIESQITYHHPWLGKIYYRGFPLEYFIEGKISFLEASYFLSTGKFIVHDYIIEKMRNEDDVSRLIKDLMENILGKYFIDRERMKLSKIIFSKKNNGFIVIQNLFILHLDNHIGEDTFQTIRKKSGNTGLIELILNTYEYHENYVYENILKPYKKLEENGLDMKFMKKFSSPFFLDYLRLLKNLALKHVSSTNATLLKRILGIVKEFHRETKRYLNIDFYTPLILEDYGFNKIIPILFISRALGLLAYALEEVAYTENVERIVYKGPINLPKERFLEKFSYYDIENK